MCNVGSKELEIAQLQTTLEDTQRRLSGEIKTYRQQIEVSEDQVTTLTARVKQLMAENKQQSKEFDSLSVELDATKQLVSPICADMCSKVSLISYSTAVLNIGIMEIPLGNSSPNLSSQNQLTVVFTL